MESSKTTKPYVGGQAVLEGVMMRSPRALAVAVRRPDGSIVVREDVWISIWERLKFLRWPLIRGSVILIESMVNGLQALNFSAQHAGLEGRPVSKVSAAHTGRPGETRGSTNASTSSPAAPGGSETTEVPQGTAGTIAVSFLIAIGLFVGLPHLLAYGTGHLSGSNLDVDTFGFHALDGVFKLLIFTGYIAGISLIPEIRRVFEYHGAEHKVVNTYERGDELTVANARASTTFHARCGTSFILFVLVLSIFFFAAVLSQLPRVFELTILNHLAMIVLKVPLMLPLAGLAYEINRYAAGHPGQLWVQALVLPGRLMQKLTTREPSDEQLEIALSAMRAALQREAALEREGARVKAPAFGAAQDAQVAVFRDYAEVASALPAQPAAGH